jgi:hypothetical protein
VTPLQLLTALQQHRKCRALPEHYCLAQLVFNRGSAFVIFGNFGSFWPVIVHLFTLTTLSQGFSPSSRSALPPSVAAKCFGLYCISVLLSYRSLFVILHHLFNFLTSSPHPFLIKHAFSPFPCLLTPLTLLIRTESQLILRLKSISRQIRTTQKVAAGSEAFLPLLHRLGQFEFESSWISSTHSASTHLTEDRHI